MKHRWKRATLTGLIVLLARTLALAEVSTDGSGPFVNTLILGTITEDPDPVGIWLQYRVLGPGQVLNSSGHLRDDGRPDIVYLNITDGPDPLGLPATIWAYNLGSDHDIAFSAWSGGAWGPTEFLTAGTDDDLDPRIFAEPDGTLHAVWWTDKVVDRVYRSSRPPGSTVWDTPVEVVAGGRRPAVAVFAGTLRVAYERNSSVAGMAQDVVVLRREAGGGFTEELVASTTRVGPLDAVLHATTAELWLDWKDAGQLFGCAERGATVWGSVELVSWPDPTWIGVEETRKIVRGLVLGN